LKQHVASNRRTAARERGTLRIRELSICAVQTSTNVSPV
jgi:hypothetical protein